MPAKVKRAGRLLPALLFLLTIAIAVLLAYTYAHFKQGPGRQTVETVPVKQSIRLFFVKDQGLSSQPFEIAANMSEKATGEAIIEGLKKQKSIPDKTRLLDLAFGNDAIVYINLSKDFTEGQGRQGNEVTSVYSLVNSLTSAFGEIKKVQLLVEGQAVYTVNGVVHTYLPLEFNKDLVEE
jgi:hypothetical protein